MGTFLKLAGLQFPSLVFWGNEGVGVGSVKKTNSAPIPGHLFC